MATRGSDFHWKELFGNDIDAELGISAGSGLTPYRRSIEHCAARCGTLFDDTEENDDYRSEYRSSMRLFALASTRVA